MSFSTFDTIVAIATPTGRGGIGVVRLAGQEAPAVAARLIDRQEPLAPRHATLVRIVEPMEAGAARVVDEVVVTWFAAPASYTGDDVVEISAHGSPVLLRRIVARAIEEGARLAEPGEFTLRAYLNGRIDLVQAEAVADLIEAVTPRQARAAMDQLDGTLTATIRQLDARLFDLAARLEASLDFPEEGFHFITRDETRTAVEEAGAALEALAARGRAGRVLRDGRTVVIAGRPNAGKSSLFNALVGSARAIVTPTPGTTRDLILERVDVEGVPVTLVDTAGAREAIDPIEAEGVGRAEEARAAAALVLVVLDGAAPLDANDERLLAATAGRPRLVVVNKTDLPRAWPDEQVAADLVRVSALAATGLDELRAAIVEDVVDPLARDEPAITNLRHLALVEQAGAAVRRAADGVMAGATEELVLAELSDARRALEEICGTRAPDELLRHIFGRFCIGK